MEDPNEPVQDISDVAREEELRQLEQSKKRTDGLIVCESLVNKDNLTAAQASQESYSLIMKNDTRQRVYSPSEASVQQEYN